MARHKRRQAAIFFPWENTGGVRQYLRVDRVGPPLLLGTILLGSFLLFRSQQRQAGERVTQQLLSDLGMGVQRFQARNDGACPSKLEDVLTYTPLKVVPRDAWGGEIRLICPSTSEGGRFTLMSDGPDKKPGGLDRLEY